jgi:MFS family permease
VRPLSVFPAPAYRWNFVVLGIDIGLFTLALTFASTYGVLPLFVHHLTASNVALGLIPAVASFGSFLPPILVAPALQRRQLRKSFILAWTVVERLPFLAIALLTLALAPAHATLLLWLFFALFAVSTVAGGASVAAWLDFVARVMPDDWRGRFFGLWSALGTLLGLAGGVGTAVLLRARDWPTGFALCFGCAFACMVVSFGFLASAREVQSSAPWERPPALQWREYATLLRRDRNFAAYLTANGLVTLAGLALAFYTVDAKRALGLTDAGAGLYAVVLIGGTLAGNVLWGYIGDHAGHKRLVEGGALCTGFGAGGALVSHAAGGSVLGVLVYGIAFALVGLGTSAVQLAGNTFVLDFGTDEERPVYIGLASLAQLPFACAGPVLGGVLADHLGYGPIFLLSLILGLAGAGIVLRYVRDPRRGATVF